MPRQLRPHLQRGQIKRSVPAGFRQQPTASGRLTYQAIDSEVIAAHKHVKRQLARIKMPSTLECVRAHMHNRFMMKIDIQDAFGSVDPFYFDIATDFDIIAEDLVFFHASGGLIQGAPASPVLFELYCQCTIDPAIKAYCEHNRITYTRYVDDLIFSARKPFGRRKRRQLRRLLWEAGSFEVNENKYRMADTYKHQDDPFAFLGVTIHQGVVSVTPTFLAKLQAVEVLYGQAEERERNCRALHRSWTAQDDEKLHTLRKQCTGLRNWCRAVGELNTSTPE